MKDYIVCLKKYCVFAGRARRREYWMFVLFNILISFGIGFVLALIGGVMRAPGISLLEHVYTLAVLLPGLAVLARRLHDIGKSGWWFLITFVPLIGWIILLVFLCRDSQPGANAYGVNPKGL